MCFAWSIARIETQRPGPLAPSNTQVAPRSLTSAVTDRDRNRLAFRIGAGSIKDFVIDQFLGGQKVRASNFIVHDAASLLGAIHAPMVASAGPAGARFRVTPLETAIENDYFTSQDFIIEYLEPQSSARKKEA